MDQLRSLIHELHRRSIWQVLSIYLMGSWGALQVVDGVTENAGLPDWVPPLALVLLVIGLPIVLATAFIQEGMPGADTPHAASQGSPANTATEEAHPVNLAAGTGSLDRPTTRPRRAFRLFTWRNAIGGGAAAALLIAVSVGAYFFMRVTGVGPVASLAAQGIFNAGEPVILAQFGNTSNDPSLGSVVTEALRVDLASSEALQVVEPARIRETLGRMERDANLPLNRDVAAEVAVREGVKAVLEGEVGSAGSGYILTATLRAAETGASLATFRRTAAGPDQVIAAIDGLSQDIREKAGESLRTIKAEQPLGAVTTASLDALRMFTEAEDLSDAGQYRRAKDLLLQALEVDPQFAMAWRKLAVVLQTVGEDEPGQQQAAVIRAYELRDRLTERERYQAVAYYHQSVTFDVDAQMRAYQSILDKYPDDEAALNNLSIAYQYLGRYEDALSLLERAVGGPGASSPAYTNWVQVLALMGRLEEAKVAVDSLDRVYPDRVEWNLYVRWQVAATAGDIPGAVEAAQALLTAPDIAPGWRAGAEWELAITDMIQGHLAAGRERFDALVDASRAEARDATHFAVERALAERIISGDGTVSGPLLQEYVRGEDRLRYPASADYYALLVEGLLFSELPEMASAMVDEWSERAEGGTKIVADYRELVDAYAQAGEDPAAQLAAMDRVLAEQGCVRCGIWERAIRMERAGDLPRAAELFEGVLTGMDRSEALPLVHVVAHEHLGRIYEALGRRAAAAEHYGRFAQRWADADPELQPRVRAARERASALGGA